MFCFIIRFSFLRAVLMQGRGIESVEYRTVMRLLYLKDSTPKEVLDEMKAVYGEDVPLYDVVKHWHGQFGGQFKCGRTSVETVPFSGHPCPPLMMLGTIQQIETATLENRRVTERKLFHEVKISLRFV